MKNNRTFKNLSTQDKFSFTFFEEFQYFSDNNFVLKIMVEFESAPLLTVQNVQKRGCFPQFGRIFYVCCHQPQSEIFSEKTKQEMKYVLFRLQKESSKRKVNNWSTSVDALKEGLHKTDLLCNGYKMLPFNIFGFFRSMW